MSCIVRHSRPPSPRTGQRQATRRFPATGRPPPHGGRGSRCRAARRRARPARRARRRARRACRPRRRRRGMRRGDVRRVGTDGGDARLGMAGVHGARPGAERLGDAAVVASARRRRDRRRDARREQLALGVGQGVRSSGGASSQPVYATSVPLGPTRRGVRGRPSPPRRRWSRAPTCGSGRSRRCPSEDRAPEVDVPAVRRAHGGRG